MRVRRMRQWAASGRRPTLARSGVHPIFLAVIVHNSIRMLPHRNDFTMLRRRLFRSRSDSRMTTAAFIRTLSYIIVLELFLIGTTALLYVGDLSSLGLMGVVIF